VKIPSKQIELSEVTQEHIDLLNMFLTGMVPMFGLSLDQKRDTLKRIIIDRAAKFSETFAKYLMCDKPKADWNESDLQLAELYYMMIQECGMSARMTLNNVQAVTDIKRRAANGDKSRHKNGGVNVKHTENKPKNGRPRQTEGTKEEKQQAKLVANMRGYGMPPETLEKILKDQFPAIAQERVNTLIYGA
jgi:chorismate mutase